MGLGLVPTVWTEQRIIESFDVDVFGRLRPQSLLAYLLNSAWKHTRGTRYGFKELSARNLMWLLIKVQLIIKRPLKWGEQITIETWSKRKERLYALRDFAISSPSGEKVISATSSWLLLDRTSGRPKRVDSKAYGLPWHPDREAVATNLEKVPEIKHGREVARFHVTFSDIDVNQHVNSSRYLQWMIDSHSREHLETKEPSSIELSFFLEALQGDDVTVISAESGDRELCSVRRNSDNKELCRARFEWRASP
jgi:medium-chain acyl-[acyl-carrier-protein] hydrolase